VIFNRRSRLTAASPDAFALLFAQISLTYLLLGAPAVQRLP